MNQRYQVKHLFYGPDPDTRSSHGVITIVTVLNRLEVDVLVHYGIALCEPGENFCKKSSIETALKRIHIPENMSNMFPILVGNAHGVVVHNHEPVQSMDVFLNVLTDLYFKYPRIIFNKTWAKRTVLRHLKFYFSNFEV